MSSGGPHCIQYLESGCGLMSQSNTGYPADRILYTLRDTHATHVITNRRHSAQLRQLLAAEFPSLQIFFLQNRDSA